MSEKNEFLVIDITGGDTITLQPGQESHELLDTGVSLNTTTFGSVGITNSTSGIIEFGNKAYLVYGSCNVGTKIDASNVHYRIKLPIDKSWYDQHTYLTANVSLGMDLVAAGSTPHSSTTDIGLEETLYDTGFYIDQNDNVWLDIFMDSIRSSGSKANQVIQYQIYFSGSQTSNLSVPNYSQSSIQDILELPFTATQSGIVYISWNYDFSGFLKFFVNGNSVLTTCETTNGSFTSTLTLDAGDVLSAQMIGSETPVNNIIKQLDNITYPWTGNVPFLCMRFIPYKYDLGVINARSIANSQQINTFSSVPSGMICWFYRSSAPEGYVICNGKWYSPDGSESSDTETETCSIKSPNLIDMYPLGATSDIGSNIEAGLPAFDGTFTVGDSINDNHTHSFTAVLWSQARNQEGGSDTDAKWDPGAQSGTTGAATGSHTHNITVTYPSGSIYGKSNTVTPPSVKLLPCMKL